VSFRPPRRDHDPATSLEWQYRDNPPQRLFAHVALDESAARFAAIYASLSVFAKVNDQQVLALQSLDTLTDSDFRGRGLFGVLAKRTFEDAAGAGAAFIYGFPNGNSAPGFFGKLGWHSLDPVPFLVRPLRSRYVLSRLPRIGSMAEHVPDIPLSPVLVSRWSPTPLERFDERVDALWQSFAARIPVAVHRNAAYLNWRLIQKPQVGYTILAVESGGSLDAFVAFAVTKKHGGNVGYVLELLVRPGRERVGRRLLAYATREMARGGADVVLAWCFPHSPNYGLYRRNWFVPFPERLRPIELHVGVRAFDPKLTTLLNDRRNWYVSYLDSDTV
jgi:GNAT superfamily N-acetyltransferase